MLDINGQVIKRGTLVSGIKIGGGRICGKYYSKLSADSFIITVNGQSLIVSNLEVVPPNLANVFNEAEKINKKGEENQRVRLKRKYLLRRLEELLAVNCDDEVVNKINFTLNKLDEVGKNDD